MSRLPSPSFLPKRPVHPSSPNFPPSMLECLRVSYVLHRRACLWFMEGGAAPGGATKCDASGLSGLVPLPPNASPAPLQEGGGPLLLPAAPSSEPLPLIDAIASTPPDAKAMMATIGLASRPTPFLWPPTLRWLHQRFMVSCHKKPSYEKLLENCAFMKAKGNKMASDLISRVIIIITRERASGWQRGLLPRRSPPSSSSPGRAKVRVRSASRALTFPRDLGYLASWPRFVCRFRRLQRKRAKRGRIARAPARGSTLRLRGGTTCWSVLVHSWSTRGMPRGPCRMHMA